MSQAPPTPFYPSSQATQKTPLNMPQLPLYESASTASEDEMNYEGSQAADPPTPQPSRASSASGRHAYPEPEPDEELDQLKREHEEQGRKIQDRSAKRVNDLHVKAARDVQALLDCVDATRARLKDCPVSFSLTLATAQPQQTVRRDGYDGTLDAVSQLLQRCRTILQNPQAEPAEPADLELLTAPFPMNEQQDIAQLVANACLNSKNDENWPWDNNYQGNSFCALPQ
ncbi:uncharacterized protein MAM_00802 [Metarhizium album ARSEF 1941]|uniref:Uncharacterized protein n=1 Tax=Metarhizium album (strain ARSEF 1941) TaxID=1081103 RepID=A0A0B2X932_METAS|nr:uncharacterized protein MAM_00802 [Metarhizium album ARSEF 1941]KHO01801.1 hypothetical protein MAM_00802 [Metarhizium album ARSEF 1941]